MLRQGKGDKNQSTCYHFRIKRRGFQRNTKHPECWKRAEVKEEEKVNKTAKAYIRELLSFVPDAQLVEASGAASSHGGPRTKTCSLGWPFFYQNLEKSTTEYPSCHGTHHQQGESCQLLRKGGISAMTRPGF